MHACYYTLTIIDLEILGKWTECVPVIDHDVTLKSVNYPVIKVWANAKVYPQNYLHALFAHITI